MKYLLQIVDVKFSWFQIKFCISNIIVLHRLPNDLLFTEKVKNLTEVDKLDVVRSYAEQETVWAIIVLSLYYLAWNQHLKKQKRVKV